MKLLCLINSFVPKLIFHIFFSNGEKQEFMPLTYQNTSYAHNKMNMFISFQKMLKKKICYPTSKGLNYMYYNLKIVWYTIFTLQA